MITDARDGDGGCKKSQEIFKTSVCFYICSPRKGTLTHARDGDRGMFKNKQNISNNYISTYISYYIIVFVYFVYFMYFIICIYYILCILYLYLYPQSPPQRDFRKVFHKETFARPSSSGSVLSAQRGGHELSRATLELDLQKV